MLVPLSHYLPEYPSNVLNEYLETRNKTKAEIDIGHELPLTPYNPYPKYKSQQYLYEHLPMHKCYIDVDKNVPSLEVYRYKGVPQFQPEPVFGSYKLLGMNEDACFDRYGRFGPYGFGYDLQEGGSSEGMDTENSGSEKVWAEHGQINFRDINPPEGLNWGQAQKVCYEANKDRFNATKIDKLNKSRSTSLLQRVPRIAVVIRAWTGFEWNQLTILSFRAMINELSLKSGGEYDVHFLMHLKDNSVTLSGHESHRDIIERNTPFEFWDMVTLWSEKLMEDTYTTPFGPAFDNPSGHGVHGAYRGLHMPLQWFASQHPDYDHFWNWEMDMRYTGHYYEFFNCLDKWSQRQSRQGIWERNAKYYIPELHGSWENFTELVKQENEGAEPTGTPRPYGNLTWPAMEVDFPGREWFNETGIPPPPGCDNEEDQSQCGVGEAADLITFNPLFDTDGTAWVFDRDISGYDLNYQIPPRRASLVAASRLSRRLLMTMHEDMLAFGHSAFPEMFPATIALHYGLKAVYAPHPVYFDRKWPLGEVEKKFNGGVRGSSGGNTGSPFAYGNEHNHEGTTWYYNSKLAGGLWRMWLGYKDDEYGGKDFEEKGTGRICLRGTLVHPIKWEHGTA